VLELDVWACFAGRSFSNQKYAVTKATALTTEAARIKILNDVRDIRETQETQAILIAPGRIGAKIFADLWQLRRHAIE
jgi:hypothetical protein